MVVLTDAQRHHRCIDRRRRLPRRAPRRSRWQPGASVVGGRTRAPTRWARRLITEAPTLVHADEHFFHANHFLTCSAAPILDPRGNILGVLDVSGDHRSYHQHTMALVKMSARMIENQWLNDDLRNAMRLQFHGRVGFHRHADGRHHRGAARRAHRRRQPRRARAAGHERRGAAHAVARVAVRHQRRLAGRPLPLAAGHAAGGAHGAGAATTTCTRVSIGRCGAAWPKRWPRRCRALPCGRQRCVAAARAARAGDGRRSHPMPCRSAPTAVADRPARRSGGRTPVPCARAPHPERADRRHRLGQGVAGTRSAPQRAARPSVRRVGRARRCSPPRSSRCCSAAHWAPMAPARCASTRSATWPPTSQQHLLRLLDARADDAAPRRRARAASTLRLVCASRETAACAGRWRSACARPLLSPQRSHAACTRAARAQRPDRTCAGHHRTRGAGHWHAAGRRRGELLRAHRWPGNLRQLHTVLRTRGGAGWQRSRDRARTLERRRRGGGTRAVRHGARCWPTAPTGARQSLDALDARGHRPRCGGGAKATSPRRRGSWASAATPSIANCAGTGLVHDANAPAHPGKRRLGARARRAAITGA